MMRTVFKNGFLKRGATYRPPSVATPKLVKTTLISPQYSRILNITNKLYMNTLRSSNILNISKLRLSQQNISALKQRGSPQVWSSTRSVASILAGLGLFGYVINDTEAIKNLMEKLRIQLPGETENSSKSTILTFLNE